MESVEEEPEYATFFGFWRAEKLSHRILWGFCWLSVASRFGLERLARLHQKPL